MALAPVPAPPADPGAALAQLLRGAGDGLRLEVLRVLGTGSYGVLELCDILGLKQPAMSHHLKVLSQAGLVNARREGNAIFYRRALPDAADPLAALQDALFATLDAQQPPPAVQANIARVRAARAEAGLAFFARHAGDFRERQDLIAEYSQYADGARELLRAAPLPAGATALEIGPGHGEFLRELAARCTHVTALDISPALLAEARALAAREGLANVDFVEGDSQVALARGLRVDLVVCNMVLHHLPSPADTFRDAATLLQPGGVMLVTDLSRHEHDWVREHCGDLWQGFDGAELDRWARAAGLVRGDESFLGLRNGFQVLFRSYRKPAAPA